MAQLLKFFRVQALPAKGVVGGLYFVYDSTNSENGQLYVCTGATQFELYSGVATLDGATGVIKTQKDFSADNKDWGKINLKVVTLEDGSKELQAELIGSLINGISAELDEKGQPAEKILSLDSNGAIKSTLSLSYDSENKKIELTGLNDVVISEIDATDFIKDGMLSSGELVWCKIENGQHVEATETTEGAIHCLKLTINTDRKDENGDPIYDYVHIPVDELCDMDAITALETEVYEHERVTAAALNDLNSRLGTVETGTVKSITGESYVEGKTYQDEFVVVSADNGKTDGKDDPTKVVLAAKVLAVDASETYTENNAAVVAAGLATDAYVREQVNSMFAWTEF